MMVVLVDTTAVTLASSKVSIKLPSIRVTGLPVAASSDKGLACSVPSSLGPARST